MIIIIIDIIFIIIVYCLWHKYGKDSSVGAIKFETYPPMDLSSAEVGQIYNGYNEDMAVVSLVLCLANKGYLKIEIINELRKKKKKEVRSFKITKIKEYDGTNENEQIFFNELFSHSDELIWDDLYGNFFIKLKKIKKIFKANEEKIYEKKSLTESLLVLLMMLVLFLIGMFYSPRTSIIVNMLIVPVLLPLIFFIYKLESMHKKLFLILLEIPVLLLCFFEGLANNIFVTICNTATITILSFFLGIIKPPNISYIL